MNIAGPKVGQVWRERRGTWRDRRVLAVTSTRVTWERLPGKCWLSQGGHRGAGRVHSCTLGTWMYQAIDDQWVLVEEGCQ